MMFLDLSARPGAPDAVKTADDIIAENSRIRDLVRRMVSAMEYASDPARALPGSYFRLLDEARAFLENRCAKGGAE